MRKARDAVKMNCYYSASLATKRDDATVSTECL